MSSATSIEYLKDVTLAPQCCSGGAFLMDREIAGKPAMPFGTETGLMIAFFVALLLGGMLNLWSPSFIKPKGCLGFIFYQRIGTAMFLRYTPVEFLGVCLVLGFYIVRFIAFYRLWEPYETMLSMEAYPGSNGPARAAAMALEEVYYAMMPMQISLAVKNMFWYLLAGLPVERSAAYHAWHGYLMTLVYVAIWICFAIGGLTYRHFTSPFCFCDVNPLAGLIGLVFQLLITATSLPIVRRKNWEYFYLMGHLQLLFPLLWAQLFNNRLAAFPWFVAGAAQWGMSDMSLRFFMKVLQSTKVLSVTHKGGVTTLRCTKQHGGAAKTLGILTWRWEPGSYVWLAVRMENANPLKGKAPPPFSKDWACYHPITIASPPIDAAGNPAKDFTMHIKSFGPGTWSEALLKKAQLNEAPDAWKVWVGGPNGRLSINPMDCDKVVLCGGGVGCTPFLALATDLHYRAATGGKDTPAVPNVAYIHAERQLASFDVYQKELEALQKAGTVDVKLFCTGTAPGELVEGAGGLVASCGAKVSQGRPDFPKLLAAAGNASDVKVKVSGSKQVVGVYACGPRPMMAAVREAVQAASGPEVTYYLHEETYEL